MKYKEITTLTILLFLVTVFILSCDAPRNNPLDPQNEDNNLATINGSVKTISFPNSNLSDVEVLWENENLLTYTDQNGKFKFEDIERNPGLLIFSHPDFVTDSTSVSFGTLKELSVDVLLNAVPKLDSIQLYSIVQNRFQFTQLYEISLSAEVTDSDGPNDIDSVFVDNSLLISPAPLVYNSSTQFYDKIFSLEDLNISSPDEVIGKDFSIIVKDLDGRSFNTGSSTVKRIIEDDIDLISPVNNETAEQPLFLNWKRFTPGYPFSYYIEIYTNQSPAELVWESDTISSDDISITVETILPAGEYFWVLWVEDEFLDRARSKPATFNVE